MVEIREGFNRDIEETDCFLKTGTPGRFNHQQESKYPESEA